MNKLFHPYRLINQQEFELFKKNFFPKLFSWNERYCLEPITLELQQIVTPGTEKKLLLSNNKKETMALVENNYLEVFQPSIFADESIDLREPSKAIFLGLLSDLLASDLEFNSHLSKDYSQWFYPGSPCLNLVFKNQSHRSRIYLNPQWVIKQLPAIKKSSTPLVPLEKALAKNRLQLTVEFETFYLCVEQIRQLKVGDLIKTDHPLRQPLTLSFKRQAICRVIPGQINQKISIQIRESL